MRKKLQYPAISKTIFVPAATIAVFSSFSQPAPAKQSVANQTASAINTPIIPTPSPAVFSKFSQPQAPRVNLPDEQPSTLFEVAPPPVITIAFSQFSQPQFSRSVIPDEQPSTLFEVLPPPAPPFTGFATFEGITRAKFNVALYSTPWLPIIIPQDTHDGVWVKRKRKRTGPDPIDLELAEKASRRAALELAIYGPEVEYSEPPTPFAASPPAPIDVRDLAATIASAQAAKHQALLAQQDQDEETDLETILREIL
jgi:hypothetical protein